MNRDARSYLHCRSGAHRDRDVTNRLHTARTDRLRRGTDAVGEHDDAYICYQRSAPVAQAVDQGEDPNPSHWPVGASACPVGISVQLHDGYAPHATLPHQ